MTGLPVSVQVEVPVAHEVIPTSHALVGVHERLAVHATHTPALQTWFVPHEVPLGAALPVSVHVATPPLHDVDPVWQRLAGTQDAPGEHALHEPLLQYMFVPHDVPFGSLPAAAHTLVPVLHVVVCFRHDPAGVQSVPVVQATHAPALQTSFVPQVVPSDTFVVGEQTRPPSLQT